MNEGRNKEGLKHTKRNKKEKGASLFNTALRCATWKVQKMQKEFNLLSEGLNTEKKITGTLLDTTSIRY
jgi:hypothetical protein